MTAATLMASPWGGGDTVELATLPGQRQHRKARGYMFLALAIGGQLGAGADGGQGGAKVGGVAGRRSTKARAGCP